VTEFKINVGSTKCKSIEASSHYRLILASKESESQYTLKPEERAMHTNSPKSFSLYSFLKNKKQCKNPNYEQPKQNH
jgi:hypothetical protein